MIDQLVLHPGLLEVLHTYLFIDVDYFAMMEGRKASDDHRKVVVLGDSKQGKVVPITTRQVEGAIQMQLQLGLSDIRKQLKRRRRENAKEKD